MKPSDYSEQKVIALRNSPSHVKYLQLKVWNHCQILNLYFLYINPITVVSAYSQGWMILVIDLVVLVVLDFATDAASTQIAGERIVHCVLNNEEAKARDQALVKKQETGKIIGRYLKLQTARRLSRLNRTDQPQQAHTSFL